VAAAEISIAPFLDKVSDLIINPLIILLFSIAFIVFIFGIVQFINSETSDKTREDGKKKIMYGLIGMTIMFSAYGIIHLIVAAIPGAKSNTGYIKF
jgi:heme/copper-type cytochrome/quinol oxidase subunit 2